jgi:prepilin-type N-terminal cleavage/methylation domain-containing protein
MPTQSSGHGTQLVRRAFTLLEVLLALALSVILLMAVYGAFDLYLRFATVGHDDMEQSQIARALLRRLSADIRSVVYRPPATRSSSASSGQSNSSGDQRDQSGGGSNQSSSQSGNRSGGSSGGSGAGASSNASANSGNSTNENSAVDATSGFSQTMTGLVGDSTTLVMHMARATRSDGQSQTPIVEGSPALSGEEKSVSYFLADTGADGLAGIVADSYKKANGTSGDIQGLARLEGNRLAIQIAQEQSNLDELAESVKLLAPEVTGLQFRYFDGADWLDTWDSGLSQRLPQAVEILLEVRRTGGSAKTVSTRRGEEPPSDVYHMTVAVPSAEPYVPP